MYIINVLVLTVLTIFSCAQGYIVPLCMDDGDACGERLSITFPGFSFYTQLCVTTPAEEEDSAVSQMLCTICDAATRFTDMIASGIQCAFQNDHPKKPETYFEILIEYLGLEHLIEQDPKKSCWEEIISEHYTTAVCSVLLLTAITLYAIFCLRKRKIVEPPDQLTFINKFGKGDEGEENSKDDLSSVNEQEGGI